MNTDEQSLRDALHLLAERAPETCPVPGAQTDDQRDTTSLELTRTARERTPWRHSPALVATVAVIAVAAGLIAAFGLTRSSGPSSGNAASAPTTVVTCAASGRNADADRSALERRAASLGATHVQVSPDGASVQISARALSATGARSLCATGRLDVRPVVMAPVPITCSRTTTPCSATAVSRAARRGGFDVPGDETRYARLDAAQRRELTAALAAVDCAKPAESAPAYRVVCGPAPTHARVAYLLGPSVFAGNQVRSARAVAPEAGQGRVFVWSVLVSLTHSAGAGLAQYTTAHHAGSAGTGVPILQCSTRSTSCADFLAFAVDGTVISAPLTLSAVTGGNVQLAGGFDSGSAKRLAAQLSGPLPVPLHFVSLRSR